MEVVTLESDEEEKKEQKSSWSDIFSRKTEVQAQKKVTKKEPPVKKEVSLESTSSSSSSFSENEVAIGTGKALVKSSEIIERRDKVFVEVFHHKKYKSKLQMRAINCILKRQCDVYVSLPTGAGKSLCYQLPAIVHGDQISSLRSKGIPCETLNSTLTAAEKSNIMRELNCVAPKIRMLYITAEGAATDSMKKFLADLNKRELLRYIIIDEAHCVTHWGHDFRPDYLSLGKLRDICPGVPWIALTATANTKAQDDIVFQLKMRNVESFKAGTYRDNLYYDVCMRDHLSTAPENHLAAFITKCLSVVDKKNDDKGGIKDKNVRTQNKKILTGSAIVYCRSRNECEQMALTLNKAGITCLAYHAGLGKKDRNDVQDKWMSNEVAVVTATVAFGMGIDKPDVRLVVHWSPSQNLAGYYQEAGRAGRDGKRSYCRIYYSNSDKNALNFLVSGDLAKLREKAKKKNGTESEKAELQIKAIQTGLAKMIEYCESAQCRHVSIAKFFDDSDCRPCETNCDYCRNPKDTEKKLQDFEWGKDKKANAYMNRWKNNDVDTDDLYGGGKCSLAKDEDMWKESASSSTVKDRCETEESQRLRSVLKNEFAKRRSNNSEGFGGPVKRTKVEEKPAEDVSVINFELKTIPNVTLETRESLTRQFIKALQRKLDHQFALYGSCKTAMTYRMKCSHKVAEIKKKTKNFEIFEFENTAIEQSGFSKASNLI
ncbi:unnamed protein product [Caenorhabditis angaria]|uniref:ATP-dependent DNA helicase n=1 Tax=Caenorhabditis angaria TaxID=860376 RepID=A0A9P1IIC6_9PELO|nr:unnamed protein product [Caenorhabditis angaria]